MKFFGAGSLVILISSCSKVVVSDSNYCQRVFTPVTEFEPKGLSSNEFLLNLSIRGGVSNPFVKLDIRSRGDNVDFSVKEGRLAHKQILPITPTYLSVIKSLRGVEVSCINSNDFFLDGFQVDVFACDNKKCISFLVDENSKQVSSVFEFNKSLVDYVKNVPFNGEFGLLREYLNQ